MSGEKKNPASGKRLGELRGKGNIPRSTDIVTTVVLAIFLFGLLYFGYYFANEMARYMVQCFAEIGKVPAGATVEGGVPTFINSYLMFALLVLCVILFIGVSAANLLQTGFILAWGRFTQFNVSQFFNPVIGIKQVFTPQRFVMIITSLIKLTIIVMFSIASVQELSTSKVFNGPVSVQELGEFYAIVAWSLGWRILVALVIISTLDFLYQKWQYARDNRMSDQEVRDESKQSEGDLEMKGRMRGKMMAQSRKSRRRMLEDMSSSTIVITNPTHYAIALRYEKEVTPAPLVIAKGMNRNARKIRERADQLGVEIHENPSLAQGLYKHGIVGKQIPGIYFQLVAQILAELFRRGYRRN
jgi:flagellar biosynthesis protein FlhB